MSKLLRNAVGSYRGTYKGHTFTVRREVKTRYGRTIKVWVACAGEVVSEGFKGGSRDAVVRSLQRQLDEAAVDVATEVDVILKRWAEQIQTITPRLDPRDGTAVVALARLKWALEDFERNFRRSAVQIEDMLAKVKARVQRPPERTAIEQESRPSP